MELDCKENTLWKASVSSVFGFSFPCSTWKMCSVGPQFHLSLQTGQRFCQSNWSPAQKAPITPTDTHELWKKHRCNYVNQVGKLHFLLHINLEGFLTRDPSSFWQTMTNYGFKHTSNPILDNVIRGHLVPPISSVRHIILMGTKTQLVGAWG